MKAQFSMEVFEAKTKKAIFRPLPVLLDKNSGPSDRFAVHPLVPDGPRFRALALRSSEIRNVIRIFLRKCGRRVIFDPRSWSNQVEH